MFDKGKEKIEKDKKRDIETKSREKANESDEKKALDAKIKKIRDQYKVGDRLNIKEWYDEDVKKQMKPHGQFFILRLNEKNFVIKPSKQKNQDGLGDGGEEDRKGNWKDVISGEIVMKKSRSKKKGMEGVSN